MEGRLYVDFNEMIEDDLVLLSKTDFKIDSNGNTIELKEGMTVHIYMDDENEKNEIDNLIATGVVELNKEKGWGKNCKWNCRINNEGIKSESELI